MNNFYKNKKVLVAVSGGIAAYKAAILVRSLIRAGAQVRVAMTHAAQDFITVKTMAVLSQHEVLTDAILAQEGPEVSHIDWAQWPDIIMVVPATANLMAKLANGIADEVVSTTILASPADMVIAPAMNDAMWLNPATQRNVERLQEDGHLLIEPATGFLAEGYQAKGRLPEPEEILEQAAQRLQARQPSPWQKKKVLITAGGTREALDPVRYLTNRSSGKMGYALAQQALDQGAEVRLITAVDRPAPYGVEVISVASTQEMYAAVMANLDWADVFFASAAVSDFRPAENAKHKIKKKGDAPLELKLVQNPDILATAGEKQSANQLIIGFAAETQNLLANAQAKLEKKHLAMVVANDVSQADIGFNSNENAVTLIKADGSRQVLAKADKSEIAQQILEAVAALFPS
ncbi:bifunctional phosphopantothenoylcysteine decarboxylase/phosphopantothenate--cysteine ligase CoaBC [Eupransor demetentiae]|uniref:Coenzyme A biosynthesis bifunctional protein CoaBC n=1 Tax=Eupransor demetentiae TaxID=3109584 RepID=A0ABM9N3R4_9LACO|nr:Phosphopantothenoylcysteine synthetase/decarboxylase CoaBC (CoaBC) [Lactobacillaceae bacterium LMG 33000]